MLRPPPQVAAAPPVAPVPTVDSAAARDSAAYSAAIAAGVTTPPPTTDTGRAPAPVAAPVTTAGDSGTLRIGQLPRGAVVMVDGVQMRQNPTRLPVGEHDILITASGHDNFRQKVRVTKDQQASLTPELRRLGAAAATTGGGREIRPVTRGAANCSDPSKMDTYNKDDACWDTRPKPSDATPPAVPVLGALQSARPTILMIHVSAQGLTDEVRSFRASNDANFELAARRYAQAMEWTPASKDGAAVDAWVQQQLVPIPP